MTTLWQHLCDRAAVMADRALADVATLDGWRGQRDTLRREFMQGLGLDPLPPRCDLKLTDHGTFTGDGYRARRIAFQIMPDCWSSANLYTPDPLPDHALPGVLYVCGHASIGTWHYQAEAARWARRGYACLILDTLEQNDNPGEHHAYLLDRMDPHVALGYTPAGGEVWNAMRALDVLAAEEHVDALRLGITGQSGGGANSFHTAIADERVKAVSTLLGVSTPVDALVNRHVMGHCACMYPHNLYARDISVYAALIAPRPLLFCYGEDDLLYHPDQARQLADRTRTVYRLYGQEANCRLVTCPGGHENHPPFIEATHELFDEHVAEREQPPPPVARGDDQPGQHEHPESVTSVFQGSPPSPNHGHLLPELISPRGTVPLPQQADDWPRIRETTIASLPVGLGQPPPEHTLEPAGRWQLPEGGTQRQYRGGIAGMAVRLQTTTHDSARAVVLTVANAGETERHAFASVAPAVDRADVGIAEFMPRLAGGVIAAPPPAGPSDPDSLPEAWPLTQRGMLLVGLTPVLMTVHDLRVAVSELLARPELDGRKLILHGRGCGGVATLYTALLDERVSGVVLESPPASHADGAVIPGILRHMDIHHAVGLMAPRPAALVRPMHRNWTWPQRVYERLGCGERFLYGVTLRDALATMAGDA